MSLPTRSFNVFGSQHFECPDRYNLIKAIGIGAYGIVCSSNDMVMGEKVAIKKISRIFENVVDCKRTLREMKLLKHFKHENVIGLKDVYVPAGDGPNFQDVYTVTELMDTDLHQIIASNQPLSDEHCQYFIYQIMRALKHIHSANVLHRDLKPSNILLNGNCDLKICDFGLARVQDPADDDGLTVYVATRWYRAPEIMLSCPSYSKAVDVWSVGCILAEILGREPLFPGRDVIHQLNLVTDKIGKPTDEDMQHISSDHARRFIASLPNKPQMRFQDLYPGTRPDAIDLLEKMLVFNPDKRITVEQALKHPYLAPLHDSEEEKVSEAQFTFEFDNVNLSKEQLRQLILEEARQYRTPEEIANAASMAFAATNNAEPHVLQANSAGAL
ncbi:hypothetical protein NDN08_004049 [Rhodosorus marinus]|uniref:Mitogen-activated protein kinase n=1 Tax=Rhodosorus marinus TaxID=101924 RepID=A0AAV8UH58_9RHOD|nr:hypothetical protein NDN08_004049 [Rhodosorus marinus]